MDVFCLPSFYEGMPVVAWEAQANGLPCVFSDASDFSFKSFAKISIRSLWFFWYINRPICPITNLSAMPSSFLTRSRFALMDILRERSYQVVHCHVRPLLRTLSLDYGSERL